MPLCPRSFPRLYLARVSSGEIPMAGHIASQLSPSRESALSARQRYAEPAPYRKMQAFRLIRFTRDGIRLLTV